MTAGIVPCNGITKERRSRKHDETKICAGTMPGVTKEQIQAAREADLFAYLQFHEPGVLKRDGPNYRHKEHDSLVYVTGKRFTWTTTLPDVPMPGRSKTCSMRINALSISG